MVDATERSHSLRLVGLAASGQRVGSRYACWLESVRHIMDRSAAMKSTPFVDPAPGMPYPWRRVPGSGTCHPNCPPAAKT
jgi:hypothetical protein